MERGLSRDQPLAGVSTFNLSEDDTPIHAFSQIFKAAYDVSNDRKWRATAVPWLMQWLLMMAKYRTLLLRQPLGRMLFSGDKLRETGYANRFGISHAIAVFCEKLASAGTSTVKDIESMRSAQHAPAQTPPAGASNEPP